MTIKGDKNKNKKDKKKKLKEIFFKGLYQCLKKFNYLSEKKNCNFLYELCFTTNQFHNKVETKNKKQYIFFLTILVLTRDGTRIRT